MEKSDCNCRRNNETADLQNVFIIHNLMELVRVVRFLVDTA